MAPWLSSPTVEDGRKVLIGGPGKPELLKQIVACLPAKKVDDLVVCSSSFDRSLSGMKSLASLSKATPVCIVQPEFVEFDGQAVRKLGTVVDWRRFVDPYPAEKRQRKDACAHAKVLVFGHGDTETCVFGSANASAPALNSTNTEIAVVLPPRSKGNIVKHLNLSASLKGKNIREELADKKWDPTQEERPESRFSCLLSAVAVEESGYRLILASGMPPKGSHLALSDRGLGRPKATALIQREGEAFIAHSAKKDDAVKIGWFTADSGDVVSNAVAITWPMVASQRKTGGGGNTVGHYLGAMEDGAVLGTILFELLDQFRDFEVIHAGSGKKAGTNKKDPEQDKPPAEQSAEFFYTDAKSGTGYGHHWTGDRIDLDILASLVQPLSPPRAPCVSDSRSRSGGKEGPAGI